MQRNHWKSGHKAECGGSKCDSGSSATSGHGAGATKSSSNSTSTNSNADRARSPDKTASARAKPRRREDADAARPSPPSAGREQWDVDVQGQSGPWAAMQADYIYKLIVSQSPRMLRMP
jgi:hypothetical protein